MARGSLWIISIWTILALGITDAMAGPVRIAVIDSGASAYVDEAYSFTKVAGDVDHLNHGTMMSKIIRENHPDAHIVMLQVSDTLSNGPGLVVPAISHAIKWAIENDVDMINMSMCIPYDPQVDMMITKASKEHGIIMLAATSHIEFDAKCATYIDEAKTQVAPVFPASHSEVIAVGSYNDEREIAPFSRKKKCDLYAYGRFHEKIGNSIATARATAFLAFHRAQNPQLNKSELLIYLKSLRK